MQTDQQFLAQRPGRGVLRVQVSAARGMFPVAQAQVQVWRMLGENRYVFFKGTTDESGIIENIVLPAIPAAATDTPVQTRESGTEYQVSVYHPSYVAEDALPVTIYDRVETILPVSLQPRLR